MFRSSSTTRTLVAMRLPGGGMNSARLYGRLPVQVTSQEIKHAALVRLWSRSVRLRVGSALDHEQLLRLPRGPVQTLGLLGAHEAVLGRGDQQQAAWRDACHALDRRAQAD